MGRARMPLNQLEMPVPHSPAAKAELSDEDKEQAYAALLGREAYERQRLLALEMTSCSCGIGDDEKRADRHKPGCKKLPLHFGRRR